MTKKRYMLIYFLFILLAISIIASSTIGRFTPTHMIVKQVFCVSCHPDEMDDLEKGRHITMMNDTQNRFFTDYVEIYGNNSNKVKTFLGPCYSCHITYINYQLFGLTDPYVFKDSNNELSAQYGDLIYWPISNLAISSTIFSLSNTAVTAELEVLSVQPSNSAIDSTVKIIFSNYSGQQTGDTVCDCVQILYQGETHVVTVSNIANDYFNIILLLDGAWNNATLNLRVSGTDKGTESFFLTVSNPPIIYNIPMEITDRYYFRTNGTYKATRLDYVWSEWRGYALGNIASSEDIRTNTTNGWITANTCSAPDGMCHINQKATYMGMNDGTNPEKSFYQHRSRYTTSLECKLCHLNKKILK